MQSSSADSASSSKTSLGSNEASMTVEASSIEKRDDQSERSAINAFELVPLDLPAYLRLPRYQSVYQADEEGVERKGKKERGKESVAMAEIDFTLRSVSPHRDPRLPQAYRLDSNNLQHPLHSTPSKPGPVNLPEPSVSPIASSSRSLLPYEARSTTSVLPLSAGHLDSRFLLTPPPTSSPRLVRRNSAPNAGTASKTRGVVYQGLPAVHSRSDSSSSANDRRILKRVRTVEPLNSVRVEQVQEEVEEHGVSASSTANPASVSRAGSQLNIGLGMVSIQSSLPSPFLKLNFDGFGELSMVGKDEFGNKGGEFISEGKQRAGSFEASTTPTSPYPPNHDKARDSSAYKSSLPTRHFSRSPPPSLLSPFSYSPRSPLNEQAPSSPNEATLQNSYFSSTDVSFDGLTLAEANEKVLEQPFLVDPLISLETFLNADGKIKEGEGERVKNHLRDMWEVKAIEKAVDGELQKLGLNEVVESSRSVTLTSFKTGRK